MKKIISILYSIFLCTSFSYAQAYTWLKTIDVNAKALTVDYFGNIYTTEIDKISKYSSTGELLATYNDSNIDLISLFEVSNPLKPIVFFSNQQSLVLLDNKMTEISTVFFDKYNWTDVYTINTTFNDSYWIFDNIDFKLKKLNKTFNQTISSNSFYSIFQEFSSPNLIIENNQFVYVNIMNGIAVFDVFGNYINTLPIYNVKSFQLFNDEIVFFKNNKLIKYNQKSLETTEMILPKLEHIIDVKLIKGKIIILHKNQVHIYSTQ